MAKHEYKHFNPATYDIQVEFPFLFNVYGDKTQKIGDFTQGKLF